MDVLWQPADEKMSTYIREKERKRFWSGVIGVVTISTITLIFCEIFLLTCGVDEWNELQELKSTSESAKDIALERSMLEEKITERKGIMMLGIGIYLTILAVYLLWHGSSYQLYKTQKIYYCCGKCVGKEKRSTKYTKSYKVVCIPDGSGKEEEIKVDSSEYYQINNGNRVLMIVFADGSTRIENVYPLSEFWPEERSV